MKPANRNTITGPYSARIDGKNTGLAGCTQVAQCPRAGSCIRASPQLCYRVPIGAESGGITEHGCARWIQWVAP